MERDRELPVHLFSPAVSREEYAGGQLESLADKLTGGSLAPLITQSDGAEEDSERGAEATSPDPGWR